MRSLAADQNTQVSSVPPEHHVFAVSGKLHMLGEAMPEGNVNSLLRLPREKHYDDLSVTRPVQHIAIITLY